MDHTIFFQKATPEQLSEAVTIIEHGRAYLKSQGINQWQGCYPNAECIRQDISQEKGYFLTDGQHCMAYLCMDFDGEPAYSDIKGAWLTNNQPYMVIHRLAFHAQFRGSGLSTKVFALAEAFCREHGAVSIRADTDGCNQIMQHIMKKAGYTYCGTIWFAGGDKIAFEKIV